MNESILNDLVLEIDDLVLSFVEKYKTHPLNISSIFLARLMLANISVGSGDDFKLILKSVAEDQKTEFSEIIH
jgi:hypothetical protein